MPILESSDGSIFYDAAGSGEPLILIPGFASGAWSWIQQSGDLTENFQVVTFDPRGIGKSRIDENAVQKLSLKVFAADVLRILDELEIEKTNVLGASFGGFVALEFALEFPERLNKLILACTSFGGANHVLPNAEILRSFAPDPTLSLGEKIRHFIRPAFTDEFNRNHPDEVEEICRLREANHVFDAVYLAQLQSALTLDLETRIGAIKNETLIITGDKDIVVPMKNSVNLARAIPNARLEIIENGSHLFFVEKAEEFNQAVINFLK